MSTKTDGTLTGVDTAGLIAFLDRVESQLEHDQHEDLASEAAYWLDLVVSQR